MKIGVNHNLISDAPYNNENEDFFVFNNTDQIDQLAEEIVFSSPACFLVSGYRGVGKTSFIRKLQQVVKPLPGKDNTIFIKLTCPQYEKHNLLLRRLIREVYLTLAGTENYETICRKDPYLGQSLALLYERTFFEVLGTQTARRSNEIVVSNELVMNYKSLISSTMLTIFLWANHFKGWLSSNLILPIITLVWSMVEIAKYTIRNEKKRSQSTELSRKTLYDDEIAEYLLKEVLEKLRALNYKLVFVIDELDKIEEDANLLLFISELKPLMLSGVATFILVSGQSLYYKYSRSQINDDDILRNVFSKLIHVSFLSPKNFSELFKKLILNRNQDITESFQKDCETYVNAKILQSSRLPRRFLNLIRQDLKWDRKNHTTYIEVSEEDLSELLTDSKILEIICKIEEQNLERYSEGTKDFFVSYLHIWVEKMKLRKKFPFRTNDIKHLEQGYQTSHALLYDFELNELIDLLVEDMTAQDLLEKVTTEEEISYKWKENIKFQAVAAFGAETVSQIEFLETFISVEGFLRSLYTQIFDIPGKTVGLRKMLSEFVRSEVISGKWLHNEDLNNLIKLRNKIAHPASVNVKDIDIDIVSDYKQYFRFFVNRVALDYSYYTIHKFYSPLKFIVLKDHLGYDLICKSKVSDRPDFLFEIKLSPRSDKHIDDIANQVVDALKKYNKNTGKINYVFLLIFNYDKKNGTINMSNKLNEKLWAIDTELRKYIYLWVCEESSSLNSFLQSNMGAIFNYNLPYEKEESENNEERNDE